MTKVSSSNRTTFPSPIPNCTMQLDSAHANRHLQGHKPKIPDIDISMILKTNYISRKRNIDENNASFALRKCPHGEAMVWHFICIVHQLVTTILVNWHWTALETVPQGIKHLDPEEIDDYMELLKTNLESKYQLKMKKVLNDAVINLEVNWRLLAGIPKAS